MTVPTGRPGPGAAGFDGRGAEEFAIGSVRGLRVWEMLEDGTLRGHFGGDWADGENIATCGKGHDPPYQPDGIMSQERVDELYMQIRALDRRKRKRGLSSGEEDLRGRIIDEHDIGLQQRYHANSCGCGFWAYWTVDGSYVFSPKRPVIGIVEGYGRTMIGERGFRSAKARIVALSLAFDIFTDDGVPGGWYSALEPREPHPDAYAIKAGFEHALAERYPSARICMTQKAMLALYPPTADYLPETPAETVRNPDPGWVAAMPAPVSMPLTAKQQSLMRNWPGRWIKA